MHLKSDQVMYVLKKNSFIKTTQYLSCVVCWVLTYDSWVARSSFYIILEKNKSFLTTYLLANTAVDTEKRNVRKNDAFLAHGEKIVFWAFFTSERNEMKPFPTVSDAQLY